MKIRVTQLLIIVFILLLIFYPEFHYTKRIRPFGILLVDRSESMKGISYKKINTPLKLKKFEFDREKDATAIGEGILDAIERYEDVSFIILFSDGANTHGSNPIEVAANVGVPIFVFYPDFSSDTSSYMSVFGPEIIEERDTAVFKIHYRTNKLSKVNLLEEELINSSKVNGEGIIEFNISPDYGVHTFEFNLSFDNKITNRIYRNLLVKKRCKALVYTKRIDWNYKFFYRYFEDIGFDVSGIWRDEIEDIKFSNYDIICFINPEESMEEKLRDYIKNGGNAIIVGSSIVSSEVLPIIAPKVVVMSKELPVQYYLKPSGIRRGVSSIDIWEEKIVYLMKYGNGYVAQFAILNPWRLRLVGKGVYDRDIFSEVMSKVIEVIVPFNPNISYPNRVLENEELRIIFESLMPDSFKWNEENKIIVDDELFIKDPDKGLHEFKAFFPSSTLVGTIRVVTEEGDRTGIDMAMLEAIADISGGGEWEEDFEPSLFEVKEKKHFINLRHNWLFISIIFILLFIDWYLWMRGK
jgi:hypothetical protein